MPQPSDEMKPVADALRDLAPATPAISRDRVIFEAGRASMRSPYAWLWKAGTLFFSGTTLALGYAFFFWIPESSFEPPPQVHAPSLYPPVVRSNEEILPPGSAHFVQPPAGNPTPTPTIPAPIPVPEVSPSTETIEMWKVRNEVLKWGPEMLPPSHTSTKSVGDPSKELDRWLGIPTKAFTAPYNPPQFFPKFGKED
jgi:hypothetical protein